MQSHHSWQPLNANTGVKVKWRAFYYCAKCSSLRELSRSLHFVPWSLTIIPNYIQGKGGSTPVSDCEDHKRYRSSPDWRNTAGFVGKYSVLVRCHRLCGAAVRGLLVFPVRASTGTSQNHAHPA